MKINYRNSYVAKGGSIRHNYTVIGTAEELADYKVKKGAFYTEDNGVPLYNSGNILDSGTELALRYDGSDYYPVRDLVEEAKTLEYTALKTRGSLEGLRQFSGMSKQQLVEAAMANIGK